MTKKKASSETGVVSWQDMMATEAKEVAKTERPSVARISLQSGIMTYQDQAVPDNEMIGIIGDAIHEQVYYDQPYEAGVVNPPACFGYGNPGDSIKAHESVPERDWKNWGDCDTCIMGQWRKPPGKGKPCSERRRLAILPPSTKPADFDTAEIAVLSLPVMSVKNWSNYINTVAAQYNRPSWGILTKIMVKPDPKSQFRVHFEFVGLLEDDIIAAVHAKRELCRTTLMVPYDLSPADTDKVQEEEGKKY